MMRLGAEVTLRLLPAVCRERNIERVLDDQINPAAGTVAEIEGMPFVKVANAIPPTPIQTARRRCFLGRTSRSCSAGVHGSEMLEEPWGERAPR